MQYPDDLSFLDDAMDDPDDLLDALPEARQNLATPEESDELGLRSLLARPEAFLSWRRQAAGAP
jgi:hypothetical protein